MAQCVLKARGLKEIVEIIKFDNPLIHMYWNQKDCFCTLFFRPRTRPRTSLQCFALDSPCSKVNHCRDVLGRVLGKKNKVQSLFLH